MSALVLSCKVSVGFTTSWRDPRGIEDSKVHEALNPIKESRELLGWGLRALPGKRLRVCLQGIGRNLPKVRGWVVEGHGQRMLQVFIQHRV